MCSLTGLAGPNAVEDMALTSLVMSQTGVTEEKEIKSVITTCAAGGKIDAIAMKEEIVEDPETVQR